MSEASAEPKPYPQRRCIRCEGMFTPITGRERACSNPACEARSRDARNARRTARRVNGTQSNGHSAPAPAGPEQPLELSSPVEVLQLAGFTVRSVRTRGGILIQVT